MRGATTDGGGGVYSIVLFYQYQEPAWTDAEHRGVLRDMIRLGKQHSITGRGRIAAEGVNCTLTGLSSKLNQFIDAFKALKPQFESIDFKVTDKLTKQQAFKRLTLRKTRELVGYGLYEDAPSLSKSRAKHVSAREYHEALQKPNSVVIDVRNAYETEIGRIVPPEGGAELVDPQLRNSHEFPKWLSKPETQAKLEGKSVMMYCTGGIRCERASALLDALQTTNESAHKEIIMVQGGIDRYLREHPDGGYWKGKNYLFDRRFEQTPDVKRKNDEVLGRCAACSAECDEYRGQFECADCSVPVLVCLKCRRQHKKDDNTSSFRCRLCREGYEGARRQKIAAYRKNEPQDVSRKKRRVDRKQREQQPGNARIVVGNLPFTVEKKDLLDALGGKEGADLVSWLVDKKTGLFYGTAVVDLKSPERAARIVNDNNKPLIIRQRKLRLGFHVGGVDFAEGTAAVTDRPPLVRV